MSEIGSLLRLLVLADKEFKISAVAVYGSPAKFESRLTSGYIRKGFGAYNNSNSASGEIVWGDSDCDISGMPIPKGALVDIPIADTEGMDVYFCNTVSGETGDLRVVEIA